MYVEGGYVEGTKGIQNEQYCSWVSCWYNDTYVSGGHIVGKTNEGINYQGDSTGQLVITGGVVEGQTNGVTMSLFIKQFAKDSEGDDPDEPIEPDEPTDEDTETLTIYLTNNSNDDLTIKRLVAIIENEEIINIPLGNVFVEHSTTETCQIEVNLDYVNAILSDVQIILEDNTIVNNYVTADPYILSNEMEIIYEPQ